MIERIGKDHNGERMKKFVRFRLTKEKKIERTFAVFEIVRKR